MNTTQKYNPGDKVIFTNRNGVLIGERTILKMDRITYSDSGYGYYITPTDTPWYAVQEELLAPVK